MKTICDRLNEITFEEAQTHFALCAGLEKELKEKYAPSFSTKNWAQLVGHRLALVQERLNDGDLEGALDAMRWASQGLNHLCISRVMDSVSGTTGQRPR